MNFSTPQDLVYYSLDRAKVTRIYNAIITNAKHSHCFFHYFSLSLEHLLSGLSSLFSYGFETLRTRSSNVPPSSSGKHSLDKKSPLNFEHFPLYFPRGSFRSPSSIYSWRMRSKLATKYLQPKLYVVFTFKFVSAE